MKLKPKMASIEEIIATKDADAIKRKRTSTLAMITVVRNSITKLLDKKENGEYDHEKISKVRVDSEYNKLVNYQQKFDQVHEGYIQYRELNLNAEEEEKLITADEKYYQDVVDKIYDTVELYAKYEASYVATKSDQKSVEVKTVAKDDSMAVVTKKKFVLEEALGILATVKAKAQKMTEFAKDLDHESLIKKVLESSSIRLLPAGDMKKRLLDRFTELKVAAVEYRDAVEAYSGIDNVSKEKVVNIVKEDSEVQDLIEVLDIIVNVKAEHDSSGTVQTVSNRASTSSSTAIKVRLNTPKFSGKSRDFAIYKKEFMDIVVPGRSDAEIGALLREGLNVKEKNLLRNNDMANYKEALDILQNEYGKPEHVIMMLTQSLIS